MLRCAESLRAYRATPVHRALRRAPAQHSTTALPTRTATPTVISSPTTLPVHTTIRCGFSHATNKDRPPRVPLEKEGEGEGTVVGNVSAGIRSNELTTYERSDFIGQLFPLLRPRADAGDVLALIDACAGHAVYTHVSGHICGGRFVLNSSPISMATVAFNAFMFHKPVFQGDLINVQTRIIHTGASSIAVYARVRRQSYDAPHFETVAESYVTMVIVDATALSVAPGHVPAVRLTDAADDALRQEYLAWREEARILTRLQPYQVLTREEVEHPENLKKKQRLKPEGCVCVMDRGFGVADVNVNNAIFGGELLRFMEKSALHCGRVFARSARLFTLGMLDMTFDSPLFFQDLARCKAEVTCVHHSTLLVHLSVVALDANGEGRSTNRASFVLAAIDPSGRPYEIENGIDLEGASQGELRKYWHGRRMLRASRLRWKEYDAAHPEPYDDAAL